MKSSMSYHARVQRIERFEYIIDTVGFGEEIASTNLKIKEKMRLHTLTDTGVIIVREKDGEIVTAFIARIEQANAIWYKAQQRTMPNKLYQKIKANRRYQENQPNY